ncbi:MAG: SMP-30/gluconolactonase/LRE family protein [Thermomicrobiales bacterium]
MTAPDAEPIDQTATDEAAHDEAPVRRRSAPKPAAPREPQPPLVTPRWLWVGAAVALLLAIGFRLIQLNGYALNASEAKWAYQSWAMYTGKPMPNGQDITDTSPFIMVMQALSYFLFGVTDAISRVAPALLGIGTVALLMALRPFVSRYVLTGMMLLAAVSPTLVYASRISDPISGVIFGTVLTFVALLRFGSGSTPTSRTGWAALTGLGLAITFASGPFGITALIALAVGVVVAVFSDGRQSVVPAALGSLVRDPRALAVLALAFVAVTITVFTRVFSEVSAITGVARTFSDWGSLMLTRSTTTPVQFFLYAALLYELLAAIFAVVAVVSSSGEGDEVDPRTRLQPSIFIGWFLAALLLQSLASGRSPEQLAIVTLPLVLLGGFGVGRLFERVARNRLLTSVAGVLPLAMTGILIGAVAVLVLIARSNDPINVNKGFMATALPVLFILLVVVAPLAYVILGDQDHRPPRRAVGWSALLVIFVLFGVYTIGAGTSLAFNRANTGLEPAAPDTATVGLRSFVNQTLRLSRDMGLTTPSAVDNTGSYSLKIAVDPSVEWPYVWYFRDFYQLKVVSPAGWTGSDMVIAPSSEGMDESGFVVQTRNAVNRVPSSYEDMNFGTIMSHVVDPGKWYQGIRFLLFRDIATDPVPVQHSVGYTFRLANQMNPNLGPFNLTDDVGPGAGLGQLNDPTGVALSPDGQTIYVVDSGNLRLQRYAIDGKFIGAWNGSTDQAGQFATAFGQGPQSVTVDASGLIYVADTWNHRIVVFDQQGTMVRELGQRGVQADTMDSPDPNVDTGRFYGPRGVAVSNGEIYVTDTGNERVQVFATDGTFLRTFGGTGTEPGKLKEPTGIAIGSDGNVYVGDSANARISVFSKNGDFVRVMPIASWQGEARQINYLAFGPNGLLYATNPSASSFAIIDPNTGAILYEGNGGQQLSQPVGITVAPNGTIYIADGGSSRVVWFTQDVQVSNDVATPSASPAASPAPSPTGSPEGPVQGPSRGTPVG